MRDALYKLLTFKVLNSGVVRHEKNALLVCWQTYDFPFQVLMQARHGQGCWQMSFRHVISRDLVSHLSTWRGKLQHLSVGILGQGSFVVAFRD